MLVFYMAIGLFYGRLVYFMAIWSILWPFGIFFPFWNICTMKNLATLFGTRSICCSAPPPKKKIGRYSTLLDPTITEMI
jgi:hypothetical protein